MCWTQRKHGKCRHIQTSDCNFYSAISHPHGKKQRQAGSTTSLQQNPPVLKWGCRLTQVDIYDGIKMLLLCCYVEETGFPPYFGSEIQGLFKDFQRRQSCIFKDQLLTEVYSMHSITAIYNIYLCDHGTVLVDKNKTRQLLADLGLGKIPDRLKEYAFQMLFNKVADIAQFDLVNSRTCPMKFNDFQAPALFSSTFKALNLGKKNSSTFTDAWEP